MSNRILTRLANHPRIYDHLHRLGLVTAFTTTRPGELACLERHARGALVAIEIGSFMGASAGVIAPVLAEGGKLFCVDPYIQCDALQAVCRRHLERAGLLTRTIMLRATSAEALPRLPRAADFVFVDGDHSWKGIETDWQVVQACLRSGGKAAFHDTCPPPEGTSPSEGSIAYFNEIIMPDPAFELVETCATLNVIRRR